MSKPARKTLVSIAIAVAAVVGLLLVAVIGTGVFFWSRYVKTESVAAGSASVEFEKARTRFAGQAPLIEYHGFNDPPTVRRNPSAPRRELVALHVLAYSAGPQQLRRVDVPARLLRLMSVGGRVRLANLDMFGDDRDRITLDDLERHGPGLVLDAQVGIDSQVSRMLVWTE